MKTKEKKIINIGIVGVGGKMGQAIIDWPCKTLKSSFKEEVNK